MELIDKKASLRYIANLQLGSYAEVGKEREYAVLDEVIAVKLNKPLNFGDGDGASRESLDMGLALSLARHTPTTTTSHALQLGAVTRQVTELQLGGGGGSKVRGHQPSLSSPACLLRLSASL